jgi:integrase
MTKVVQGFVAYLAGEGRSRKTTENVLLTLSSLLRTARSWGYACGEVKAEPRSFTDDEVRKIIANASEPLSTIVKVTAVLGLRIGETLALRTYDVDFGKHVIRVRQSVDAATRTVSGVNSKASSADLPMSKELEARLRTHSRGTITKMSCSSSIDAADHSRRTNCGRSNCIRFWVRSESPAGDSIR